MLDGLQLPGSLFLVDGERLLSCRNAVHPEQAHRQGFRMKRICTYLLLLRQKLACLERNQPSIVSLLWLIQSEVDIHECHQAADLHLFVWKIAENCYGVLAVL